MLLKQGKKDLRLITKKLDRVWVKPLAVLLICSALVATTCTHDSLNFLQRFPSIYSYSFVPLLFFCLLPGRFFFLAIPLGFAIVRGLRHMHELKISTVALPITSFDVNIFIENPMTVINAVGLNSYIYAMAIVALIACSLAVVAFLYRRNRTQNRSVVIYVSLACVAVVLFTGYTTFTRYGRFVHDHLHEIDVTVWRDLWLPSAQAKLSRKLGPLEYLAFSSFAAREPDSGPAERGRPPDPAEVRGAAAKFVSLPSEPSRRMLPNVVIFHAESSFDPNAAFKLSSPVSSPLWSDLDETKARGPLHVNIIGGGSWVTEFEVLTGVDSRLFGYEGFYTHYYIAPKVKNSFVKYAARKGYKTIAFYTVEGDFYNARKAFLSYGFDRFIDGTELGLPADWDQLVDREIVAAVLRHKAFTKSGPFLYFISTSENHGPHPCTHFNSDGEFLTTFALSASFEQNCQLNEYLRRASSTGDAVQAVLKELKKTERLTGRPFVLLIYGDHQPWSFTEGVYSIAGGTASEPGFGKFSKFRTSADSQETFFHVLASDSLDRIVKRDIFKTAPPALLLPSLLSAFLAISEDDLYLPQTFLAFMACGSDLRSTTCGKYAQIAPALKAFLTTESDATTPRHNED